MSDINDSIKIKVCQLQAYDLDWLIAAIEGHTGLHDRRGIPAFRREFNPEGSADEWVHHGEMCCYDYFKPTSRWEQGGPLLEKHRIDTVWDTVEGKWRGKVSRYTLNVDKAGSARLYTVREGETASALHSSRLMAGMLALVHLHYGEEIDYPFETVARK